MDAPLRIVVADDHPLFRKGLVAMLSAVPSFEIVAEAATGAEAVADRSVGLVDYGFSRADIRRLAHGLRPPALDEFGLVRALRSRLLAFESASGGTFSGLNRREREILDELAQGHENATIARHLSISPRTVANHLSTIFDKLQVADRGEAIVRAREAGFGSRESADPALWSALTPPGRPVPPVGGFPRVPRHLATPGKSTNTRR